MTWIAHDGEGDYEEFSTEEEAISWANKILECLRRKAACDGEWSDVVEGVLVARIVLRARAQEIVDEGTEHVIHTDYELEGSE